jgi:transitional endoplasmic reticulum ATPase
MNQIESHVPSSSLTSPVKLSPAQSRALEFLLHASPSLPILHIGSYSSLGRTTILQEYCRLRGGHWLDIRPFVEEAAKRDPHALEEAALHALLLAVEHHPVVIVDDFNEFFDYAESCSGNPRGSFYQTVMKTFRLALEGSNRKVVLGGSGNLPNSIATVAWSTSIDAFEMDDYRHLFSEMLGKPLDDIDFEAVHRFASHLDCHRIERLCHELEGTESLSTNELIEFIQNRGMSSNVDTSEVQQVRFADLCGVDDVIAALEDNIILPLENLALAKQLGLTPKRGVMLAGPPGTGKTTIGRALAHRLRGKFFLIDGTVISGTEYFYQKINHIFYQAMANAPSIVFIDDSDVIFDSGKEHGLYRYLLTVLDGLESERSCDVCVMMTAMDLGNIPPALVRSGRIELWLEMKMPDEESRRKLLQKLFADRVQIDDEQAWPAVIEQSSGFTGADLKRMVQDAKLKMAADMVKNRPVSPFHEYLLRAAKDIHHSRNDYARSAAKALQVNSDRPRWFNVHPELFENSQSDGATSDGHS